MSSAAQTLANQQNSQHSTGPRTAEGKRQSSFNSLRHGLTSQLVVLPNEDAEAYAALRAALFRDYAPETTEEQILTQTICDSQWRLERALTLEANLIHLAHHEEIPAHIAAIPDPAHRQAMITAHGYDKREKKIHNLHLQAARLQRTILTAFARIHELQAARGADREAALAYAVKIQEACTKADLIFEPALFGFDFTDAEIEAERERRKIHQLAMERPQSSVPQPITMPS